MEKGSTHHWHYLIERYLANTISRQELEELLRKADAGDDFEKLTEVLKTHWNEKLPEEQDREDWEGKFAVMMRETGRSGFGLKRSGHYRTRRFYRVRAAAFFILLIGVSGYFLFLNHNKPEKIAGGGKAVRANNNDIPPGSNGAVLTLGNGQVIVLDSAANGTLAVQGNTKVIRRYGKVVYEGENNNGRLLYNTMTTPRGRQYQLVLADGSKVWLNAASSIRYPTAFTGKERRVEISGEVYFEVAHNQAMPFRVAIRNRGEVEVLGTHFNINAYEEEPEMVTTLIEGSVKLKPAADSGQSVRIKPGEQARMSEKGRLSVEKDVDTDEVMAWKNGYFSFNQTGLDVVMRQISRWYDVDIVYTGKIPDRKFGGEISRNSSASQVLKILEESKVHFSIEGKKIIVQP
jgi:hypothetical protein